LGKAVLSGVMENKKDVVSSAILFLKKEIDLVL